MHEIVMPQLIKKENKQAFFIHCYIKWLNGNVNVFWVGKC